MDMMHSPLPNQALYSVAFSVQTLTDFCGCLKRSAGSSSLVDEIDVPYLQSWGL
jgi:hypothetical protein